MTQELEEKHFIQGSPEWHEMRKNHLGASDAPVVMNMSPWKKPLDLWREKVALASPQTTTGPMLYGMQEEPRALRWFNEIQGVLFVPCVHFHKKKDYLMASLDGYCHLNNEALEIKCPGKKDHELGLKGIVPEKYIAQLQHQIEVCGLDWIWYCSYSRESQHYFKVARDQAFIDEMLEKEAEFWDCVINFREPN